MVNTNDWSRVIESTHAIMCALFAFIAFVMGYFNLQQRVALCVGASMGTQLMNSILYMAEYSVQMEDPYNVNYPTEKIPSRNITGKTTIYVGKCVLDNISIIYPCS